MKHNTSFDLAPFCAQCPLLVQLSELGIIICFLNGGFHPKSAVGSKVWVKNMLRSSWARRTLRIVRIYLFIYLFIYLRTFVDDFPTLNYFYLGGITVVFMPCHRKSSQSECRKSVAYLSVFHQTLPSISAI